MHGHLLLDGQDVAELRRIDAYEWGDLRALGPADAREFRAWLVSGVVLPGQRYVVRIGTSHDAVEVHAVDPAPPAPETVRVIRGRVRRILRERGGGTGP